MSASPPPPLFPRLLESVRVLDASRVLAGPFCGQLLGDLGAEVIKIERPGAGDETRGWGPPFLPDGTSAYYLACNRNKKGIALDLAQPRGRALFHDLARQCDVVLENFLPDSAAKLGLAPAALHAVNPRLIVVSISGFGRTGPLAPLPGYDFAIQAMSGLMSITGPSDGAPCKVGVAVTDVLTGLYAAGAALACLVARGRTGHGYAVDLALLDCAVAAQVNVAQAYLTRRQLGATPAEAVPPRQGNAHLQIVPYQLFATADGWMVLAVGNDGQWARFAAAFAPALAADPRFHTNPDRVRHRDALVPALDLLLRERTTAEWARLLDPLGVPHAPLMTYADLFSHPHASARGLQITVRDTAGCPVDLLGSPLHVAAAGETPAAPPAEMPPALGADTDAVLRDLCGLDGERLAELRRAGVIG